MSAVTRTRVFLGKHDTIEKGENNLVNIVLADGQRHQNAEPRRLFPVNDIYRYITLLSEDGKELAVIRSLDNLDPQSAQVIIESLDQYYLVPQITRIDSITGKSGRLKWCVSTNRGEKTFEVRDRNHDIKVYNDGHIRVRDSHDNRYVIDDYRKLDKHSIQQLISDL